MVHHGPPFESGARGRQKPVLVVAGGLSLHLLDGLFTLPPLAPFCFACAFALALRLASGLAFGRKALAPPFFFCCFALPLAALAAAAEQVAMNLSKFAQALVADSSKRLPFTLSWPVM